MEAQKIIIQRELPRCILEIGGPVWRGGSFTPEQLNTVPFSGQRTFSIGTLLLRLKPLYLKPAMPLGGFNVQRQTPELEAHRGWAIVLTGPDPEGSSGVKWHMPLIGEQGSHTKT